VPSEIRHPSDFVVICVSYLYISGCMHECGTGAEHASFAEAHLGPMLVLLATIASYGTSRIPREPIMGS
jgi:hypothetical protein